jgi:hypothetical protein
MKIVVDIIQEVCIIRLMKLVTKTDLVGEQRALFLTNEGRQSAGTGYYSDSTKGFDALVNHKPLERFGFGGREDWTNFHIGFKEVQDLRILVMLLKAKAQADNTWVMKELEGTGLTFLQERVK